MRYPLTQLAGLLFTSLLFAANGFCQQAPLPKTLLWKISGNGLQKPSYLFGTLHLTDKQIFNFGDSLYNAMETTEGFAIEIHPDSAATAYLNGDFEKGSLRPVTEILSAADLQKIAKKMEQKLGKKASDITEKDIIEYRDKWMRKEMFFGKNKMNVFMDAYLYAHARDMGKWVGGIEDVTDQTKLTHETLNAASIKTIIEQEMLPVTSLGRMKQIYINQDLDGIQNFITKYADDGFEDKVLIKRNRKMAWRMDSLSHVRSSFFAVGAAHLPGDSGLISLLTKRGFRVEPVISSQTIAAENYPFKKMEMPWQTVKSAHDIFTIAMPGLPQSNIPTGNTTMQMYMDITSNLYYYAAAFPINGSISNPDSLLNKLLENYLLQARVISSKNIEKQSLAGKEIIMMKDSFYLRLNVFTHPSAIVFTMTGSPTLAALKNGDAEKFFNSLVINKEIKGSAFSFATYTYPKHGFKIDMPFKPFINQLKDSGESAWNRTFYDATDAQTGEEYVVFIYDTKKGFYVQSGISSLQEMCDDYVKGFKGKVITNEQTNFKGFPAIHNVSNVSMNGKSGTLEVYMFYKGNRAYLLLGFAEKTAQGKEHVNHFFESFQATAYEKGDWAFRTSGDGRMVAWLPAPLVKKEPAGQPLNIDWPEYNSFYEAAPLTIYADAKTLSPYFWVKDDTTFLHQELDKHIGDKDSLISKTYFKEANYSGFDILLHSEGEMNVNRKRILLHADTLYTFSAHLPLQDLALPDYQKMFSSFHPATAAANTSTIFERKPATLLAALSATDSVVFNKAFTALQEVNFEASDLPLLMNALLHRNKDFDSTYDRGSNAMLVNIILEKDSAQSFVPFIEKNYAALTKEKETLKPFLLSLLVQTPTNASFSLLKKLLVNDPPQLDYQYYLRNKLYDSLQLSKQLFPGILQRANDPGLYKMITYLTGSMLDSNLLQPADILPFKKEFIAQGKTAVKAGKEEMENHYNEYFDLVKILGIINDNEAVALLNGFLKFDNKDIRIRAIKELAKNNRPVESIQLFTIAGSDAHRAALYEALKDAKRLNLFPKEFATQKQMATSDMYGIAMDEETPLAVKFVKEKIVQYHGKKHRFYLFKIEYADGSQLGVAGPYALDVKDFYSGEDASGLYGEEYYDAKKIDAQFMAYMKQLEE